MSNDSDYHYFIFIIDVFQIIKVITPIIVKIIIIKEKRKNHKDATHNMSIRLEIKVLHAWFT